MAESSKESVVSLLRHFKFHKSWEKPFLSDSALKKDRRSVWRPDDQTLLRTRKSLERILTENILPFWYPEVVDTKDGGYRLNHDLQGRWRGPANKHLVTQARTVWFFSRLVNSSYKTAEYLQAAAHGYDFLRNQMWDKEFGGFYWEVDASGHTAGKLDKRMYGQSFGLYALTEYTKASGDSSAKATAEELFGLLEAKAHDTEYAGYLEILQRDWSPIPAHVTGCLNRATTIKRMNTHLHRWKRSRHF